MSRFKRLVALISTIALSLTLVPVTQADIMSPFDDVPVGSEFFVYINGLYDDDVVDGVGGNYFPFLNVNRSQMAKFVVNGAGIPTATCAESPHFDDIGPTHTLYIYVETMACLNMVSGRGPREFAPEADVLRQEGTAMAMRGFRWADAQNGTNYFASVWDGTAPYNDVPLDNEFVEEIGTATGLNAMHGYGGNRFGPYDPMRRDQMAKVIYNFRIILGGGTIDVTTGMMIKLGASHDAVKNDGTSQVTITAEIWEDGVLQDTYDTPVTFVTDLGTFDETDTDTVTETPTLGRADVILVASTTAGVATITASSGSLPDQSIQVEFDPDAPRTTKGFGGSSIAGVGSMQIWITDDMVPLDVDAPWAFGTDFIPLWGGFATGSVYVQDSDDVGVEGENISCSIIEGNGDLTDIATGITAPSGVSNRSVTLTEPFAGETGLGRYVFYINALNDMAEQEVVVQCVNLDTNPTNLVEAAMDFVDITIDTWVNHDSLLTRNLTQVGAGTNINLNAATGIVVVRDHHGDPLASVTREIKITVVDGQDVNGQLIGCLIPGPTVHVPQSPWNVGTAPDDVDPNWVYACNLTDADANPIPGYYTYQYIAGTAEGSVTLEARDTTAIGPQPTAEVDINIYDPEYELWLTSENVGEATSTPTGSANGAADTAIIAAVYDHDGVPVPGETVCIKIGGDAGTMSMLQVVPGNPMNPYNCGDNDAVGAMGDAVQMEPVEYPLYWGVPGFETGFYAAQYDLGNLSGGDYNSDLIVFNNFDRFNLYEEEISVKVKDTATPSPTVDDIDLVPLETEIGPQTVVPILVIAQDDENYGVEGLTDGANQELIAQADQNGAVDVSMDGGAAPLYHPVYAAPFDGVSPNWGAATGNGLLELGENWAPGNTGWGCGGYITTFQADQVAGTTGKMRVTTVGNTPAVQALQQLNIVDYEMEVEVLRDRIMTDEAIGVLIYVWDYNDDPVRGLQLPPPNGTLVMAGPTGGSILMNGLGNPPTSSGIGELFDPNIAAYLPGSGVYVFDLDTTVDVLPGTVDVTISGVVGRVIQDTASFDIVRPEVEVIFHPDFAVRSNATIGTVRILDPDDDTVEVPNDYIRAVTNQGCLEDGNATWGGFTSPGAGCNSGNLPNGPYSMVSLRNWSGAGVLPGGAPPPGDDGIYLITYGADVVATDATVYVELYSGDISGNVQTPPETLIAEGDATVDVN